MTIWTTLKFLHFFSIVLVCLSIGAMCLLDRVNQAPLYARLSKLLGTSMLLVFLSGAVLVKYMQFPFTETWLWVKAIGWLILGAVPEILYKLGLFSKIFESLAFRFVFVSALMASIVLVSVTRLQF